MKNSLLTVIILLALFSLSFSEKKVATEKNGELIKILGTVEESRVGTTSWIFMPPNQKLVSGDKIRTSHNSGAIVKLIDNSLLYISDSSSIKIESAGNSSQKKRLLVITLYYGKLYFSSGSDSTERFERALITPEGATSVEGKSGFLITSNGDIGTTSIQVLHGSVSARNPLYPEQFQVGNKMKIYIDKGRKLEKPETLDTLYAENWDWLNILDSSAFKNGKSRSVEEQLEFRALLGEKPPIVICKFNANESCTDMWDIEQIVLDFLSNQLKESYGARVIQEGQRFSAAIIKQWKGRASAIISGKIDNFSVARDVADESKQNGPAAIKCKIKITCIVTNPSTQKELGRYFCEESQSERDVDGNSLALLAAKNFTISDTLCTNSIIGKTLQVVVKKAKTEIKKNSGL